MKILTQSEVQTLVYKTRARPINPIVLELRALSVGQAALVTKEEWTNKTPPYIPTRGGSKFKLRTLKDESGWVVTRIV